MRNVIALGAIVGLVWLGCAEADSGEDVAINKGALGHAPFDPALDSVGSRYIVKFHDAQAGKADLVAHGARIALDLPSRNAAAAHIPAAAVNALSRNPAIDYIELDQIRRPLAETVPFGVPMVQADLVSAGDDGSDVLVCIIDSGLKASHEDHAANASNITGDSSGDRCGHGTHVAGTVAAVANALGVIGVYPSASLHIVKVFGDDCVWSYASNLVGALDDCVQAAGTRRLVVSMSLGGDFKDRFEEVAFADADANGVLSIAAAGNDGNTRKSYPASYPSVVSVAAIDSDANVADFSQQNSAVEIAAPGVSVLSTVPYLANATIAVDGGPTYSGSSIEFSPETTNLEGHLVDGGLCGSPVSGAAGAIVICQRGDFSFADKINNAHAGGAVGVVIYNNVAGGFAGTCGEEGACEIPGIGISDTDGAALLGHLGTYSTLVNLVDYDADGYESWNGTSMATPHVSGVAALVWSQNSDWTNDEIRGALNASALDLPPAGRDVATGYGLVQAKAALEYLGDGPSCSAEVCDDEVDNDCDGLVDGDDPDCQVCTPTETTEVSCSDTEDNDCDGLVDGADPDCGGGTCGATNAECSDNSQCCSGKCRTKGKKAGTCT